MSSGLSVKVKNMMNIIKHKQTHTRLQQIVLHREHGATGSPVSSVIEQSLPARGVISKDLNDFDELALIFASLWTFTFLWLNSFRTVTLSTMFNI